jgi:hypothetical protein
MDMELDVSHGVFLERGPGSKLERPELLVSELDRIPESGVALFAAPPGTVHTFTSPGPDGARLLNMHTPDAGFADFLRSQTN